MRFKDDTPGAETDYNTCLHSNQMLEEVLSDLCIPGATWKLGGGQPPHPIQLRRKELQPLARGWLELIINNIHPSSNRSELCKDAGVSFREYRRTPYVEVASKITAKVMETVRGGTLPILRRYQEETGAESWANHEVQYEQQQHNYYEPHQSPHQQPQQQQQPPQHFPFDFQVFQEQQQQGFKTMTDMMTDMQIETLNYFENIKTYQEYQYDQMKSIIAQQQEVIATQNRELQAMRETTISWKRS
ncbi:hypothetical protein PIB30_092788 [Stylosanthes scabra]|uniref:Uncharacterized protein n=1 Tax=Stylosanthes scabra TaxID=79078 RepID=A0ABU6XSL7_9FABA|nr:hypothetical protein [Stylosanthes scabra]